MTYAIGQIVYGIDLQPESYRSDRWSAHRDEIETLSEEEDLIDTSYSGNGEAPVFFGVCRHGIDECNAIDGADLISKLEADQYRTEYAEKLRELDEAVTRGRVSPELAAAIKAKEPRVFITWGSS